MITIKVFDNGTVINEFSCTKYILAQDDVMVKGNIHYHSNVTNKVDMGVLIHPLIRYLMDDIELDEKKTYYKK